MAVPLVAGARRSIQFLHQPLRRMALSHHRVRRLCPDCDWGRLSRAVGRSWLCDYVARTVRPHHVLNPVDMAAMYLHGERRRPRDADWQPHVVVYLGVPIAVSVVGYVLSGALADSINPAGDAMYVFLAAFWVSATVYLSRWWTTSK